MTGLCVTPQECLAAGLDGVAGSLATGLRTAAGHAVTSLFTGWIGGGSASVQTPVVESLQHRATAWIALPVAVLAILTGVAANVGAATPSWPRDVARGLLVFGITATGSIPVVAALQRWSDALSAGLLGGIPAEDVGRRFITALSLPGLDPLQVGFWSALVVLAGTLQSLALLFRDGAVLVLSVLLPVAAAGQFGRGSVLWLPRVAGWLLAFLLFKPAAALVYDVGFSLFAASRGVQGVGAGLCVIVTAVLALPALLRLVSFAATAPDLAAEVGRRAASTVTTGTGVASSLAQLGLRLPKGTS